MNISVIGDSIRMNSEKFILTGLPESWQVKSPSENCESSHKVASELDKWLGKNTDVVHVNCGLHDIRYNPGSNRPVSTLEEYETNLNVIFSSLAKSNCLVIWATSTPFLEAIHNTAKASKRYEHDLLRYNETSVKLAVQFGFHINDLYSLVSSVEFTQLLLEDGLHFTERGNKLIGKLISKSIVETVSSA